MTARSANDLAADRLTSFIATTPANQAQADALADVRELRLAVARLETAEADARAVREKMEHNAANLDFAIQQRQELEAQVAALAQERDRLAEALREFGGKPGGLLRIITEKDNAVAALADARRALEQIEELYEIGPAAQIARHALAATGGGTAQSVLDELAGTNAGGTGQEQQP